MTLLEAINTEVQNNQLVEKYCIFRGLDCSVDYDSSNFDEAEIVTAYCYKALLTQPDWSEDGLSVKYSRSDLIRIANTLFTKHDLTDELISINSTVTDKTGLW